MEAELEFFSNKPPLETSPCGVLDAAVAADGGEASYTTHGDPNGVSPLNTAEHYITIDLLSVSTKKRKIQALFFSFFVLIA